MHNPTFHSSQSTYFPNFKQIHPDFWSYPLFTDNRQTKKTARTTVTGYSEYKKDYGKPARSGRYNDRGRRRFCWWRCWTSLIGLRNFLKDPQPICMWQLLYCWHIHWIFLRSMIMQIRDCGVLVTFPRENKTHVEKLLIAYFRLSSSTNSYAVFTENNTSEHHAVECSCRTYGTCVNGSITTIRLNGWRPKGRKPQDAQHISHVLSL